MTASCKWWRKPGTQENHSEVTGNFLSHDEDSDDDDDDDDDDGDDDDGGGDCNGNPG